MSSFVTNFAPICYWDVNISPITGLSSNRNKLSCPSNGQAVDLWHTDDNSGRQKWRIQPVAGLSGVYNIIVAGGTEGGRTYLSCTSDGKKVDLWTHDDASGRQRWVFTALGNYAFEITVHGGVSDPHKKYLSCTADGHLVDLYGVDDASGRQQWLLSPVNFIHQGGAPRNVFAASGLSTNRNLLSCPSSGQSVDLWSADDNSGRQKWTFVPVKDMHNHVYNIIVHSGTEANRKYLSCTSDGSKVDLYTHDDNSGRQRWNVIPLPGGKFHIKIHGGVSNPSHLFLSCTQDGTRVDLYSHDDNSGRQQWLIK